MNMQNGMYFKGEIRAVKHRQFTSKKTGEVMNFYSLIVEESAEADKKEIQLSKALIDARFDIELLKLVGKTCVIPFYITFNSDYLNYHYSGNSLPVVIEKKPVQGAA